VAVVSFAHGHSNAYCEAISHFEDARVVAAWDENAERGRAAAERWNLEFESDLQVLAARADIDAFIVTSETNRHADHVEVLAPSGKPILCQKPLATTREDCERITRAVEAHNVRFQMAFQMRCDPLNLKIKEWIDAGELGRIGLARRRHCINFLFNPPAPGSSNAWHIDATANVGMFFDDAVHAADFFVWLFGRPKSVMAEIDNVLTDVAPDDTGLAIFRWESGLMASLCNASVTLAGENTCEIYGDAGVVIQNWDDGVSTPHAPPGVAPLKLFRKSSGAWEPFEFEVPSAHFERLKAVPRPWIDGIRSGKTPGEMGQADAREGTISVEMCLSAYESARDGRRVSI
jgi:predicted dehydrogenase